MVGAVAESRAVETGVTRLVDLLCCVALHEQVDRHDTCTLQGQREITTKSSQLNTSKDTELISAYLRNNAVCNIMHSKLTSQIATTSLAV